MTLPQDMSKLQSEMSAAVREHWKAFLFEGILLVILGLAAMIVPPLASLAVTKCYAISPDCAEVATRFYGVRDAKVTIHSLGTDTDLFHPAETDDDRSNRQALRQSLGFGDDDIVCVY